MTVKPRSSLLVLTGLGGLLAGNFAASQTISRLVEAESTRIEQAQAQQEEINGVVSTTRARFDEYQSVLREIEGLEVYNNLLQAQIDDQNAELDDLRNSIDQVSVIERQMLPLMTRMIASLELFIEADMPFLLDERRGRVEFLKELVNRSDVSAAEQFRNVMDAWQREMGDYGSSSEVYVDDIMVDGRTREVRVLRIGRIALLYLTPDGNQAGAWDQTARQWVPLDSVYNAEISAGIEAVESGAPALFTIPVASPEEG